MNVTQQGFEESELFEQTVKLSSVKHVKFWPNMDQDDDDGVGFVAESHYLTPSARQAVPLLQVPRRNMDRESSISSNVSEMDLPIYSSDTLTTRPNRAPSGVSTVKPV